MSLQEVSEAVSAELSISLADAKKIVDKAKAGGEISDDPTHWFEERFKPNLVFIDETGYAQMCVNALKILDRTAATDYGSSRQRDLGQLWADMTRGYLGEYAFKLFAQQKWGMDIQLDHEVGNLEDFLRTDVHSVSINGKNRPAQIGVSIKTSKWNGIWLDIPGDQFNHTDTHVFVKVGTGRDHLFAFFKSISVFKDKVLRLGEEVGSLSRDESDTLFNNLPTFTRIPAYITGFVWRDVEYEPLPYSGKTGRKHFTVTGWNGEILPGDLEKIKTETQIVGNVKFEGIGQFSHDKGYLFNTGNLLWRQDNWQELFNKL